MRARGPAELARLRFNGGVADFLQVLDAERTQLEAQDQLAQSRSGAATAYAALYKALGGSWPAAGGEKKQYNSRRSIGSWGGGRYLQNGDGE